MAIRTFLRNEGYTNVEHIEQNDWYVPSQFDHIYQDLINSE
jgi:hypothetical protein